MKEEIDFEDLEDKELFRRLENLIKLKQHESSALQKILKGLDKNSEIKEKTKKTKK